MNKKAKKVLTVLTGMAAAWAFAIKPRLRSKPDLLEIRGYDFAHRGYWDPDARIPENSMAAFQAVLDHGYGIMMDVRISRDGDPVVIHDSRLSRMCGVEGIVENSSRAELNVLKLSGTQEGIPGLREVLDLVDGQVPVVMNLHVLNGNYRSLCNRVCEILDGYDGVFAIESIDPRVLKWFRDERSEYIRGQMIDHSHRSGTTWKNRVWDFFCDSLLMNFLTSPDFISCNMEDRKNLSLRYCELLYHVDQMYWTVENMDQYEQLKTNGQIPIFQGFEP